MKSLTTLLFTLLLLASCGGKKAQTTFSLNAGALINGSNPLGGAVIVGSNGSNKFSAGLSAAEVSNFSIDLPQGNWNFYAVAWLDDLGEGPMSGKARCGISQAQVQGSNVSIELSLTNENCAASEFGPASTRDTTTYGSETTFKKINLNSCNNPVGYPILCDSTTIQEIPGESVSLRFEIPGYSSFGANPPSLNSVCLNPVVHDQGLFNSNIRVPIGASSVIPVILNGYEKLNCIDGDAEYALTNSVVGLNKVDSSVTANNAQDFTLTFADNYVGVTGSPFIDAQNNNKVKLPILTCGGHCYNTTNKASDFGFSKDDVREGVWSLFGSVDQKESYNFQAATEASFSLINASSGQVVLNTVTNLGSKGNNISVTTSISGAGNTATTTCNASNKTISITATTDIDPNVLAADINANCTGFVTASVANGTIGLFTSATSSFSGGTDTFNGQGRRYEGSVNDLKHILFGAVGAILYANGVQTWTQLCSVNGSYSYELPNDSVVVSLSSPSASAVHPLFSTTPSNTFERKLLLRINNQNEEVFFFNCNDGAGNNDHAVGTYFSYKNDNRLEYMQTSWDVTNPNSAWVDRAVQQTENGFTVWRYDLFRNTGITDDWSYWGMTGSDEYASYRRIAGTAGSTPGTLNASSFAASGPTDVNLPFVDSTQIDWSISAGLEITSGPATTVEPVTINASITNPRTYPSFSTNDMINNATFWNFSY